MVSGRLCSSGLALLSLAGERNFLQEDFDSSVETLNGLLGTLIGRVISGAGSSDNREPAPATVPEVPKGPKRGASNSPSRREREPRRRRTEGDNREEPRESSRRESRERRRRSLRSQLRGLQEQGERSLLEKKSAKATARLKLQLLRLKVLRAKGPPNPRLSGNLP